jgi:hypothetical protein
VQKTIIDGQVYFDRDQDIARRPELEREKQALLDKEKKAATPEHKGEKKPDQKPDAKPDAKPDEHPKPPQAAVSSDGGAQ